MKLKSNFPLSKITSFKLGGPAKFYFKANSPEEVLAGVVSAQEKNIPYLLVAGGTNTVFSDKGFDGLIIHFHQSKFKDSDFEIKNNKIIVSASVILFDLVKKLAEEGLSGLEKLSAIPGCVGGAIVGNAGAYGQYVGELVDWVEIFDGQIVRKIKKTDCNFGYRHSIFKEKNWLVLRVCLKLKKSNKDKLTKEVKDIAKTRWQKFGAHPVCAGSFFKNVDQKKVTKDVLVQIDCSQFPDDKIPAGYLIGESIKNKLKMGGISIAPFHNNFLINDGTGKTKDLVKLAEKIKSLVKQKFGIELEEEVRYIL